MLRILGGMKGLLLIGFITILQVVLFWGVEDELKRFSGEFYGVMGDSSKFGVLCFIFGEFMFFVGVLVRAVYRVGD